jgi:SAM-dependent methyltransferase
VNWGRRAAFVRAHPRAALTAAAARIAARAQSLASAAFARLLRLPIFAGAIWRALCADPAWTPANNLAVGAEIMRRVRAIPDPAGANRYLPHRWRRIFVDIRTATAADIDWSVGPVFLNFGAGDRNPLALSMLAALAGASRAIALEPGPLRADVATATLQETLWDVVRDPSAYGLAASDLGRLRSALDADALARGDKLADVLAAGRIELSRAPGEASVFPPGSIDLVYSRSVLEHVIEIETAMARLVDALKPGGIMMHDVALDAHDADDPLAHCYVERPGDPGGYAGLNGWRLSDYLKLFGRLGCAAEVVRTETIPLTRLDRKRLLPRFSGYSDADLLTVRAMLMVRKPKPPTS